MANAMNKDQFILDYDKQRISFIEALKRFNANKGTPFDRLPEIGGQEVDLYHLYQKVTGLGGWHKVNNDQLWDILISDFWLPKACTNAVEVLKHVYFRYLTLYEKVNFLGEDVDTRKNDDEDGPTRKKICLPIESIPLAYNYNQHKLTDAQRQQYNLSTSLMKRNPYEKLELSLQSGLPNDVDHAVNVCILLSTEGRHTIDLHKAVNLIELLLAHIGIFEEELGLEDLYSTCWSEHKGRDFLRFWYESVKRKDIRSLITYKGHVYSQREMAGEDVLNLGRDVGVGDVEGQRVLQIGTFLRNLSFEECNQQILAASSTVFKFLILCLYNTYGNLKQMALDTIANLSSEICLVSVDDFNTMIMLDFIQESLVSEDRFCLVRGMEVMSKICQLPANESVLSSHFQDKGYRRLVDLLTIQDIQIIVHSLETLYKLSKIGEPFTTKIAKVHKAIDILVNLITIEAQSFGPGSLVGIKVVEYVPPVSGNDMDVAKRPTTVIQPVNPDCVNIYQIPSSLLAQTADAKEGTNPVVKPKAPVTDIQATSTSWLKATYESKKRSKVNQVELFSDYLQFCRKFGIKNTLSSAEFLQMVKTLFDQVDVISINRKNGDRDVFFEGLCKRSTQRPFAVTTIQDDKGGTTNTPARPKTPGTIITNSAAPPSKSPQVLPSRKLGGRVLVTTPMSRGKRKAEEVLPPQANLPNQPPHQSGQQASMPEGSMTDPAGVKSLLAKKLCQVSLESTSVGDTHPPISLSSSSSINNSASSTNTITSQPFNTSQHVPGTFVVCPAVTSSLMTPSHRPVYQQGKSSAITSDIWCTTPAGKSVQSQAAPLPSQSIPTVPSSQPSQSHPLTIQPSSLPSSLSSAAPSAVVNNHIHSSRASIIFPPSTPSVNESIKTSNVVNPNAQNYQISNPIQQSIGNQNGHHVIAPDSSTIPTTVSQNYIPKGTGLQGTSVSIVQNNNRMLNTSITASVPSQPQSITLQQPSFQNMNNEYNPTPSSSISVPSSGVSVMQQGANLSVIPQHQTITQQNVSMSGTNVSLQGSNLITMGHQTAGLIQQQPLQALSQANPSIAFNQLIQSPSSNIQVTGQQQHQQSVLAPTNMVSMATANVTQSISTPAVAAMLSSSNQQQIQNGQGQQQQQQMVISMPLQQAAASVNRPSFGGVSGVPSTVVIQTQPGAGTGTIVMPSRQVVLQGNMGSVQQNVVGQQAGTVSFVVPQYRQTSSLIIQQGGGVNMLPSLTLQTQQPLAQSNPVPQTLTGQLSTATLGNRQIVINQNQLPVGMQISSLAGNAGNICVAPQQQSQQSANIVIQPNNILSQPTPPNNIQLSVNGAPVMRNESLSSANRSDVINTLNHSTIPQQPQELQVPNQISMSQQLHQNQPPNQLVVQTSQQEQTGVCNGVNHEVNGVLGSPDSMSSDLPPSPQSTGLQSDIMNGQLSDSDSNKSDLAKLVDKSGRPKINGIIHNFENGCFTNNTQQQPQLAKSFPPTTISTNSLSVNKSDISTNGVMTQSGQAGNTTQVRVVNGTNLTVNSVSQQSGSGTESVSHSGPQKIIVNVVQRQQPRLGQVGNSVNINGLNQQSQQVTLVSQQQQSGGVIFQQPQQQPTNTVLQQQQQLQQIGNAPVQQLQSKTTVIKRVVVNNIGQQHHPQQSGTVIIKQQQQQSGMQQQPVQRPQTPIQTSIANQNSRELLSISRPQTRVSTLQCPSTAPSPIILSKANTPQVIQQQQQLKQQQQQQQHQRPVITRPAPSDSDATGKDNVKDKIPPRPGQGTQTNITSTPAPKRKAAIQAMTDKTPIRLRRKKGDETEGASDSQQGPGPVSIVLEYKCEWGSCRRNFPSARLVFLHVFRQHIPNSKESCCQWFTCEKMVRKRWSLVSHIQDYHCTEMAMRSACHRRFTVTQNPNATLPPPPPQPMVYPPDAAAQAIRRFAIKQPFPEFAEQREGPVSKHIRLTAALILRNICHNSSLGRMLISRHEQQLSYNCMNPMDSSTALSSCLWDILHYGEYQYKSSTTASHLF